MMNLSAYTTSTYDLTLTEASTDYTSSLSYESGLYTHTSTESGTNTYWISSLQDSRIAESQTRSSTNMTSSTESVTSSSVTEIGTTVVAITSSTVYKGDISQDESTVTWSRSLVSLISKHTGVVPVVTITSYAEYTYRTTVYNRETSSDTLLTSTIYKTVADASELVMSLSRTDYYTQTIGSYATTTDLEYLISKGVASSLMWESTSSALYIGDNIYSTDYYSTTSLVSSGLSGTVYNSLITRLRTSESTSIVTSPASKIQYTSMWYTTYTDWNNGYYTYISTSTSTSVKSTSSISYLSATLFPQECVYSVSSSIRSYTSEWIISTRESIPDGQYLGSLTLNMSGQSSTSTTALEQSSLQWIDYESSWTYSSNYTSVPGDTFIYNSYTEVYSYTTTIITGNIPVTGTAITTRGGRAVYESSGEFYSTESWPYYATCSLTQYSSSTVSSTISYSSTTYTNEFGTDTLSIVLSNYSSSTSATSHSLRDTTVISDIKPELIYTEYYGSGSTTYQF